MYRGRSIEFCAIGLELEVQKWPRQAAARWQVWVVTKVFFFTTELSSSMSQHGSLCRNMVHRLQAVAGSPQGFS